MTIGGAAPIGGFSLTDVVMVNGQRVVYFSAADSQGNLQVGGAPPLPASAVTVPVNNILALLLTGCAILGLAVARARAGAETKKPPV